MEPVVKLVQISDLHLQQHADQLFRGHSVEARYQSVLQEVFRETDPDLLLLTGDLVHHGYLEGYQRLKVSVERLPCVSRWLPGNHDLGERMLSLGGDLNRKITTLGDWIILTLDSTSNGDGFGSGSLADEELNWLAEQLQNDENTQFILIALHHNPLSVESAWQNRIGLQNAEHFWQLVEQSAQCRGVICGHLHYPQYWQRAGVEVFSAPATAPQFKPACEQFTLENDPQRMGPGWRSYHLHPDGRIVSEVHYLPNRI